MMDDAWWQRFVTVEGNLNLSLVSQHEVLYEGRNGRSVVRFWVDTEFGHRSFIFKPASYTETVGRELWLQDHLIPYIRRVRVPKILAVSPSPSLDTETYWMVMEDAGSLTHNPTLEIYCQSIDAIPCWHGLSVAALPAQFMDYQGLTPTCLVQSIQETSLSEAVDWLDDSEREWLHRLFATLTSQPSTFFEETIVSHGDYHIGNIGMTDEGLVILDWENAHVDCVYCDLYALLDKTHPRFPKPALSNEFRIDMLRRYWRHRGQNVAAKEPMFIRGYFLYSLLHSLWMLTLIAKDLQQGLWDVQPLLTQREQTRQVVVDGLHYLATNGGEPA